MSGIATQRKSENWEVPSAFLKVLALAVESDDHVSTDENHPPKLRRSPSRLSRLIVGMTVSSCAALNRWNWRSA